MGVEDRTTRNKKISPNCQNLVGRFGIFFYILLEDWDNRCLKKNERETKLEDELTRTGTK